MYVRCSFGIRATKLPPPTQSRPPSRYADAYVFFLLLCGFCRDGGNTFTPERYKLELNSEHTFTVRQAPSVCT